MICPNCNVSFHPQMTSQRIGRNSRDITVYVFIQMCPECKEPVVGTREQKPDEILVNDSDVQDLTLMVKQKN